MFSGRQRTTVTAVLTAAALTAACSGSGSGSDAVAPAPTGSPTTAAPVTEPAPTPASLTFTVEGVTGGANVPVEFTCDGANDVPTVSIDAVPEGVAELALVVDDPDAPTASPFVHWLVYGIDPATATITDGDPALTYGTTDAGLQAWFGPCPPPGDGPHTYRWKLFALSSALGLEPGADGRAVEAALDDDTVADALLIASYERAG